MYTHKYVHMYIHAQFARVHTNILTLNSLIHMHTYTYMYTYTHTHTHTHTYTHTHTHTFIYANLHEDAYKRTHMFERA